MREGGRRLACVLESVGAMIAPGVSTAALDAHAEDLIRAGGDEPAFLGYQPPFADSPYPATLCVSINDEVVHGIPTDDRLLREGDIVGLDIGLWHRGLVVDMAMTFPVGAIDETARELLTITHAALGAGIAAAQPGNTLGDIGYAIETVVAASRFSVVSSFGGHGVGHEVHEEPHVFNVGKPGTGMQLEPGMVLALEPMVNEGSEDVAIIEDGYTAVTEDGKRSAHFEHTIAILEDGPEVLTRVS